MSKNKRPRKSSKMALTPGGLRPKGQIHLVSQQEKVQAGESKSVVRLQSEQSPMSAAREGWNPNRVLTPGGFRHKSLVHPVEPGHTVRLADGGVRLVNVESRSFIQIPKVSIPAEEIPGLGSGWIAYTHWTNATGKPITSFRTTWQVPAAPATQASQTIFLFNGIDPSDSSSGILQPVLQWGPSAAGGGAYWSVASWYVGGDGHAFHTSPVQVNVGDTLVGSMKLAGRSGSLFNYFCEFEGIAGTSLPVENLPELVWCNETLEAYSVNQCSDYPATDQTRFKQISIQTDTATPSITWIAESPVTDCGQHASVVSNSANDGAVDIFYRAVPTLQLPLDEFAKHLRILFGVTNDGGGIVMLPDGHIVRIPPWDPEDAVFRQLQTAIIEAARGISARTIAKGSASSAGRKAVERSALEMSISAFENVIQALKKKLKD